MRELVLKVGDRLTYNGDWMEVVGEVGGMVEISVSWSTQIDIWRNSPFKCHNGWVLEPRIEGLIDLYYSKRNERK